MSLKSGRHGIGIKNLNWKTGEVKVPTPAGQIVKTFTQDFAMATSATLHDVTVIFSGFEWSNNYVPIITLIAPTTAEASILSVNCVSLRKDTSGTVTGLEVFVNQSGSSSTAFTATLIVAIVNKTI